MSVKIIIVDDHELVRQGIRGILEKRADYAVIGEARNGCHAVNMAAELSPAIVLMDLYMPLMTGVEATEKIRAANGKVRIIGLSSCTDRRIIARIITAGASAYVSKAWPSCELFRAIDTVYANHPYHFPALESPYIASHANNEPIGALSARELQTLQLIAAGQSSKDIAVRMSVCLKTVEAHRHNLRRKLGRSNIADLLQYAIREGIVQVKI